MKMNNLIKGSISIFLIITFVANYLLAALLVDATRVHAAKTEVQAAAEIATQNILTRYDEYLYELYGLFAVTDMDQDAIASSVKDYIDQMVCLGVGEDSSLSKVMDQSAFFDAGIDKAWKPYELDLKVTAGSNVTLASNDVLKSQILDQMKFRAPVQIADSFLDFLDTVGELEDTKKAVEEKTESDEKLQDCLDSFEEAEEKARTLKNKVVNYTLKPTEKKLSSDLPNPASTATKFVETMENMDKRLGNINVSSATDLDNAVNSARRDFISGLNRVSGNAQDLCGALNSLSSTFSSLKEKFRNMINKDLVPARDAAANDSSLNSNTREAMKNAYQADINNAQEHIKKIDGYISAIDKILEPLNDLNGYSFSATSRRNEVRKTYSKLDELIESIKEEGKKEEYNYSLKEIVKKDEFSIKKAFWQDEQYTDCAGFFEFSNRKLQKALDAVNGFNIGSNAGNEVNEKVKKEKPEFEEDDERKLNDIPADAVVKDDDKDKNDKEDKKDGAKGDGADTLKSSYGKSDASHEMDNIFSKLTDMLSELGTDIRDNLYIDEYIMTYFRSYVHHYRMVNDSTVGKDGYDKVISPKYGQGQYIKMETTAAELEYILIGSTDTFVNLAGVYGEILLWRMALNTLSVFMTPDIYQSIIEISSAAGMFAPLVVLGLVLVTAATQSALDTQAIMSGKEVSVVRTELKEWGITLDSSGKSEGSGTGSSTGTNIKAGYSDYVRLILLLMPQDKKLNRIRTVINMNMRKANNEFNIENTYCNVYANVSVDMGFLLLSPDILNTSLSQPGKYHFDVGVNSAY